MGRVRLSRDFRQAVSIVWNNKGCGYGPVRRFSHSRFIESPGHLRRIVYSLGSDFSSSAVVFKRQPTVPALIDTDGYISPRAAYGRFYLLHR